MKKECWNCNGTNLNERKNHYECKSCGAITIKESKNKYFSWDR